ncbi:hypothetical protein LAZ67_3003752 [Cordylochernes scorpioides]|uniref:CCHC-type domain-containing protein n=1 Tax=Cordylochernes scorpioides TaxID=51811 RepID=A0ABY6KDF7_9ARAC|nr:hypothetical protein LAZ67_3003752 [Cordylochernes scorpioides]
MSPYISITAAAISTILVRAESPLKADQMPGRHNNQALPCAEKYAIFNSQRNISNTNERIETRANSPAGGRNVNSAAPFKLAAISSSNRDADAQRSWADYAEDVNSEEDDSFTLVKGRKRRRDSPDLPAMAAQSNSAGTSRRQRPSTGRMPQVQEIRTTGAHVMEARARQASCTEEQCCFLEYCPEYQTYQYMKALEKVVGNTRNIVQFTKVNGQYLVGLANRSQAERLVREGLEIEGTLLKTFPFRRTSIRVTIGNLPFFVGDAAVMDALSRYGRITSIAPKQLRVGEFDFTDGRREAFILLHDGITVEMLPSRFELRIKGEPWPAFLTHGIKCSKCRGQGHRRANCPQLHGRPTTSRRASPPPSTSLPPSTAPGLPRRTSAAPPSPAMEVCSAPPVARAVLHPSAPRPSPPAAPALPMEETPSAPPPVTPAPSLQAPEGPVGPRPANSQHPEPTPPARPDFVAPRDPLPAQETLGPAAPTPDVEMSIVEETSASSTSAAKNATRVDLDALIERHPSVSFAETDALGLGREEVLDLLSSRTKAQRKGLLLSPPQCDALVGLIGQILDLRPGAASNLYKVLGEVKAELRTTPAVPPTPPLPAPRPAEPTPPAPQRRESAPTMAAPPPPPSAHAKDDPVPDRWKVLKVRIKESMRGPFSNFVLDTSIYVSEIVEAVQCPEKRESFLAYPSPRQKIFLAQFLEAVIEHTQDMDPSILHHMSTTPAMATPPPPLSTQMDRVLMDKRWEALRDLIHGLNREFELDLEHRFQSRVDVDDTIRAILYSGDREPLIKRLPTRDRYTLGGRKVSRMATNFIRAESPSKAEQKPVRHGEKAQPCAELSKKEDFQKKTSNLFNKNQNYANLPAGGHHANPATPTDFVTASFSEAAAQANRSWADLAEDNNHESEEPFITVQRKKRRRGSAESPAAAAPSSNIRGAGAIRRPRSSTGWAPRAEEIRTTRAHIAEARARQASSTEDHCVYVERSPELEPFHYMRAIERMFGGTREVFQLTKMNGHFLVGLANRGMAERLINEGLEVEGTLHRAFPFRKRAERITVGNLPFFVGDAAVISALSSFGRVTSIAPKLMKAGPYIYNDGRREAFIIFREGMTIERLPTRLDITIKGEAWPAYLSSGIRCSRCRGQGHRRANCPLLAGLANNTRLAPPTTPAAVPSTTTSATPQRSAAQPPTSASSSPARETPGTSPAARAVTTSTAPRPSPPVAPAVPMEEAPSTPPPVTPAPSLQAPGGPAQRTLGSAAPTPDVKMSIVEETFASSTSSAKNATRVDLDAFIEGHPSVSFAETDALGLGREEVLDLLSSRTKAQRKGPLLSPPQCDALVGVIGQILNLRPGAASNLYKVLGQVKAELRTTPAEPPTPPLPAPRPSGPTPPTPHSEELMPAVMTPPPPALEDNPDLDQWEITRLGAYAMEVPARPDFVAPRNPLSTQKTLGPAAPTPDVEMSIVEETSASSTSSAKNATRVDLDAFIERYPSVSFAGTDALGLGREEVLDLLSSRTRAKKRGPLLSPPQSDALAGLIGQILDLKPGHTSNLYKVLGQVGAELTKTPAAAPTPPLPAPRPAGPTPPVPHEEQITEEQEDVMIFKIFRKLKHMTCLKPLYDTGIDVNDLRDAILFTEDRASLMTRLSPALKGVLAEFLGAAIELARGYHHDVGTDMARLRRRCLDSGQLINRSLEQRYAIKFCVRLGKNATETFQMLQKAFKDDCISRSQSGKWHKAFKKGREEVADEPLSGRPTTARTNENVDCVLEVLRTDRRLSIQQISNTLHMSTFVVHGIVTEDLQMRKVCAKLVPKVLTQDQKELRVFCAVNNCWI